MPFVLRKTNDESNPTLPDAWGVQQTRGRLVCWIFQGGRVYFLILFCRGGKYGCDGLNFFHYKGVPLPEFEAGHEGDEDYRNWFFHPGTVTKQIVVKHFTADHTTNTFTSAGHNYANDTVVRAKAIGGALPTDIPADTKLYIVNTNIGAGTFQLSLTSGGAAIDIPDSGSGTLTIWKADAGFDDPLQGRPRFFPELNLTFSNICYIEGMIPSAQSSDAEPTQFEFGLRARKVADFDAEGNILGASFSANNARVFVDIVLNELKRPRARIHWESAFAFKQACDALIWQRTAVDSSVPGTGLTGRYFNGVEFNTPVITRTDAEINFDWGSGSPATGVNTSNFSLREEGKTKFEFAETYTFTLQHDDGARLWIDGELIIDQWGTSNFGTHIGQITVQAAGQVSSIKLEYQAGGAPSSLSLKWSSPSRALQIVPTARLYTSDAQVNRYGANIVATGIQAGAALDEVMKRAPGWHFQDVNGVLKFLPPNRPVVHHFVYDPAAADQRFDIVAKTFEATERTADERPNHRFHFFNNLNEELLKENSVEGDRPELREEQGGFPTDIAPARWGVMTRSQVERCAEDELRMFSDADRNLALRGQANSYHVSKGDRCLISHIATGDTYEEPVECIVTAEGFGAGEADEKSYTLLPRKFPLIEDEPVVEEDEGEEGSD